MTPVQFGQSVPRREDDRLLTGRGQYVDDVRHPGALTAVFVRSPYPSARIVSIDSSAALAHPGVVAVLTYADVRANGVDECPRPFRLPRADGGESAETRRPLLADDRVRFVGEPVALVIADGALAAQDAAELVMVDYESEEAITDVAQAAAAQAPQVWPDRPGNLAFHWRKGEEATLQAALAASHHVTRLTSRVSRVSAVPMELRGALAYPGQDGRMVIHVSHQSPHMLRNDIAAVFGLERSQLRVIAGDVGGSFGMKSGAVREEMTIFWAARRLQRPVRWNATRSDSFLGDDQARDVRVHAELGLDANGRFTALRVRYEINVGAYMSWRSTTPVLNFGGIAGVYTTPVILGEALGYFSHTPCTTPYRGAGRPDATYAIERIIDVAAAETGIDPAELRRRNLIPPQAMPYQTPFLFRYDCGEFERNLDRALALARYAEFPARRQEAARRGKLRGIGISNPIEVAGGPYARPATDWSIIEARPDGGVDLITGAMSVGQGLDTALSTVVAQRLGLPLDQVRYVQGDTDTIADGKGNGGSAALIIGGTAASLGVDDLLAKAQAIAARELEVSAADLQYADGAFRVPGSDIAITLGQLAAKAREADGAALAGAAHFTPAHATFPNGCHICEVEIDPDTGSVQVVDYVSVEDVGRVLNPMLVEGQIQGGVAQGIGQALMEQIRFDDNGQLVTGSFMDYAMPRASDLPRVTGENPETPTQVNPLGVKGVGEAGTVGALAATMNAVCNALQVAGIRHLDMPATPMRVWQALRDAGYTPGRGTR
jgi:carbon-monoxide dehydrogenase large subunit